MKRAFITRRLPAEAEQIIFSSSDAKFWELDGPPSSSELVQSIGDAEGLLCLLTDRIDDALLSMAPNLRIVSQMAVGYDNIDIEACKRRGISVGNTPGVLTESTADLAFGLLLATARRISESELFLRNGNWKTWSPLLLAGTDVHHKTIGIIGMGRIGLEVARRAYGFNMRIIYSGRRANLEAEQKFGAVRMELPELLAQSDFVSLHVPLSDATRNMIGEAELEMMKPTGILINTARGPVVDQVSLAIALAKGTIAGAGLDVFSQEPLAMTDPLLNLPNVVLLPHVGSATVETRTKMAVMAANNLVAGLTGQPMPHQVC